MARLFLFPKSLYVVLPLPFTPFRHFIPIFRNVYNVIRTMNSNNPTMSKARVVVFKVILSVSDYFVIRQELSLFL